MFASLPMYHRAETAATLDAIWEAMRNSIARAGLVAPLKLDQSKVGIDAWLRPDMVLSQTCGMPFRKKLYPDVVLVGTIDHGVEGCEAGYYNSVIIKQRDRTLPDDPRPVVNDMLSQSGYAALLEVLPMMTNPTLSGAHLNSAKMVADGVADIAAIDAVTWRLIKRFEPFHEKLQVLQTTTPRPALPLITKVYADQVEVLHNALVQGLDKVDPAAKKLLGVKGLVHIPASAYLSVTP